MATEDLRKHAKRWLKQLRAGDTTARERFRQQLPGVSTPGLRQVQQALARERGHESWAALKEQAELERLPPAELIDELLRKACLSYGDDDFPSKWQRAGRIVARYPEVATSNLYTAVVTGEVEHVRRALARSPAAAKTKGGPQGWEPLLFLCYGRLATEAPERSLEIARLLLDAGADPNAYFVFDGSQQYRFTALTGAMGEGELAQPPHPRAFELAELLLQRGAHANDSQGLYDTCLQGDDTRWLELLARFGLGPNDTLNWQPKGGARMLDYLLVHAAGQGRPERLGWLLAHGADPNAISTFTGNTCYQTALLSGHQALADLLLQHGARAEAPGGVDAFVAAARRGDRATVLALVSEHPEYLVDAQPLVAAAGDGDAACVQLLLELGMDPNRPGRHGYLALHNGSKYPKVVELLCQHGADARARCHGGTSAGWALHHGTLAVARLHAEKSRYIFDAVMTGHVELVRELLSEAPARALERTPTGNAPLHALPQDPETAEPILRLLLEHGADPLAKNDDGKTAAEHLEAAGRDVVADLLESSAP